MSSEGGPFRGAAFRDVPPFVIRYVAFAWYAPLQLALASSLFLWGLLSGVLHTNVAPWAFVALLLLAVTKLPVVTLRARVEGGSLIVDGYQWPGTQTHWSCTMDEAHDFVLLVTKEGRHTLRQLALRTTEGRACPLTERAYRGVAWPPLRALNRMNVWLRSAASEARASSGVGERVS